MVLLHPDGSIMQHHYNLRNLYPVRVSSVFIVHDAKHQCCLSVTIQNKILTGENIDEFVN